MCHATTQLPHQLPCCLLTAQGQAVALVVGVLDQAALLGALARPPHRGAQQLQQGGAGRLAAMHHRVEGLVLVVVQLAAWVPNVP